jgi:uncharacterized SAM-binding protein YcdF (DUF218 family)
VTAARGTAIVLGAAVRPDGTPSPTLRLRVEHAVALFHRGEVGRLVLTGGRGRFGPAEAEVARDLARSLGMPAHAIRIETASTNTVENLAHAIPLVDGPAVIVTNCWHLPRARLAARLLGLRAFGSGPRGMASLGATLRALLREVAAVPLTILRALRWRRRSG